MTEEPENSDAIPHLYVTQNEFGLIKIGRSHDVERRCRYLARELGCQIDIVAVVPESGHMEEYFHITLDHHCVGYEWFDGTEEAKAEIVSEMLIADLVEAWPFALDRSKADAWLDSFYDHQATLSIKKSRLREFNYFRTNVFGTMDPKHQIGNRSHDLRLWRIINEDLEDEFVPTFEKLKDGTYDAVLEKRSTGKKVGRIPDYTTVLDDALLVWPDSKRPKVWTICVKGSTLAFTCAVMGLAARWNIDPNRSAFKSG